jgi:hypothetical protein
VIVDNTPTSEYCKGYYVYVRLSHIGGQGEDMEYFNYVQSDFFIIDDQGESTDE